MGISISRKGERVILRSPWQPELTDLCRSIPGARVSRPGGAWQCTYPLSMNVLRELRKLFGEALVVDPGLMDWAREARRKELRLKRLSRRSDARLRRLDAVAPKLAGAMGGRTYQRVGARFVAEGGNVLIADEPGLGKTVTSLAGLVEAGLWSGDHLIVCPKSSIESVWARQIDLWFEGTVETTPMPEGAAKRQAALDRFFSASQEGGPRFLIVNPDMLRRKYGQYCSKCKMWKEDVGKAEVAKRTKVDGRWVVRKEKLLWPLGHQVEGHNLKRTVRTESWPQILNHEWRSVIVDEAHNQFSTYRPKSIPQNTQGLLDIKTEKKVGLTGTPLRGHEANLWGLLDWFDINMGGYWTFIDTYFEKMEGYFGSSIGGLRDDKKQAFYSLLDSVVLRRTRMEVRSDLPQGRRIDITVPLEGKHAQQYEEFVLMGEVAIASGSISGNGLLSELTRLKQMAYGRWDVREGKMVATDDSPKAQFVLEWLRERGVTGKKSSDWLPESGSAYKHVIASQLTGVLDGLERTLVKAGIDVLRIDGSVSGPNRKRINSSFQSDTGLTQPRVLLIQTQTGGVSIELDAWCDEMIILDETFVADDQVQLEGRTENRSGRVAPRSWTYLRTEGTIEQHIAEGNWSQHNLQHKLLDGRRGVDVALHLLKGN